MSVPPFELGILMPTGETLFPPEVTPRLKPLERILIPQPGFLPRYAAEEIMRQRFPEFTNQNALLSEDQLRFLEKAMAPFQSEIDTYGDTLSDEYDQLLITINHLAGWRRTSLVRNRSLIQRHNKFTGQTEIVVEDTPELHTNPTVDFQNVGGRGEIFLRDLFTATDDFVFVNPDAKLACRETRSFMSSPLGEGGKVLVSGKTLVVAEDIESNPDAQRHIDMLKQKGYIVQFIPQVDASKQQEKRKEFVSDHIDGHAALIAGHDKTPTLFVASSYATQDERTQQIFNRLPSSGIAVCAIDDSRLPHLAFNIVQFSDNTVLLAGSGLRNEQGKYEASELEKTLVQFLGKAYVHRVPSDMTAISHLGIGSIRCLVNIAPISFIQHIQP